MGTCQCGMKLGRPYPDEPAECPVCGFSTTDNLNDEQREALQALIYAIEDGEAWDDEENLCFDLDIPREEIQEAVEEGLKLRQDFASFNQE